MGWIDTLSTRCESFLRSTLHKIVIVPCMIHLINIRIFLIQRLKSFWSYFFDSSCINLKEDQDLRTFPVFNAMDGNHQFYQFLFLSFPTIFLLFYYKQRLATILNGTSIHPRYFDSYKLFLKILLKIKKLKTFSK